MIFPQEFIMAWRQPGVKAAFVSDLQPVNTGQCGNCGGAGIMSTFVAVAGPFKSPVNSLRVVAHFQDGAWWTGSTYSAKCPVCQGSGAGGGR